MALNVAGSMLADGRIHNQVGAATTYHTGQWVKSSLSTLGLVLGYRDPLQGTRDEFDSH